MEPQILLVAIYGLAMAHGYLWSKEQRQRAVEAAYSEIRDEVRRERSKLDRC